MSLSAMKVPLSTAQRVDPSVGNTTWGSQRDELRLITLLLYTILISSPLGTEKLVVVLLNSPILTYPFFLTLANLMHYFSATFSSLSNCFGWINQGHVHTWNFLWPYLMPLWNSLGHLQEKNLDTTDHSHHGIHIAHSKKSTSAS